MAPLTPASLLGRSELGGTPWDLRRAPAALASSAALQQPNGRYAVCCRHASRLRFRTVGFDLAVARRERLDLIAAVRRGEEPVSPHLLFETVAGWWLEGFEAMAAAQEWHPRTLEAHRYHVDQHLLPAMGRRRIASTTVDDVAELRGKRLGVHLAR